MGSNIRSTVILSGRGGLVITVKKFFVKLKNQHKDGKSNFVLP